MNALRFLIALFIIALLAATPLLAQGGGPLPAGERTPADIALGYSFFSMNLSGSPNTNLNGVDSSATIYFHPVCGATFDSSYVRAGRDPGSGHSSYVLSVLTGPVFVAKQNENTRLLIRALAGVSLVDSSVQVNDLYYRGYLSRFSWGIGTGIERNVSTSFAVRFNVDYLRTSFVNSAVAVEGQNSIRVSANVVFRFAPRREARDIAAGAP